MQVFWTTLSLALDLAPSLAGALTLARVRGHARLGREQALRDLPRRYQHHLNAVAADPSNPLSTWKLINFVEHACAVHHRIAPCREREMLESAVMDFMSTAARRPRAALPPPLARLLHAR